MTTDPIADFFISIKNAYMAHKNEVNIPYSNIKYKLAQVLLKSGYLKKVEVKKNDNKQKYLKLDLLYIDKEPKMTDVIMVSKPGRRTYVGFKEIPVVLSGLGIAVVSTPEGVMTGAQAKKRRIGGELICKLW